MNDFLSKIPFALNHRMVLIGYHTFLQDGYGSDRAVNFDVRRRIDHVAVSAVRSMFFRIASSCGI